MPKRKGIKHCTESFKIQVKQEYEAGASMTSLHRKYGASIYQSSRGADIFRCEIFFANCKESEIRHKYNLLSEYRRVITTRPVVMTLYQKLWLLFFRVQDYFSLIFRPISKSLCQGR